MRSNHLIEGCKSLGLRICLFFFCLVSAASANQLTNQQVKYIWVDGNTGKIRFSTTATPPTSDACLSNYAYFMTDSIDVLSQLLDAKTNRQYITINYTPRSSTGDCPNPPTNTDNLLATVNSVSLSATTYTTTASPITSSPSCVPGTNPHCRLAGITVGSLWVRGCDQISNTVNCGANLGNIEIYPGTAISTQWNVCSGFKFNTLSDAGKKLYLIILTAKVKQVPFTAWYYPNASCQTDTLAVTMHAGLMY